MEWGRDLQIRLCTDSSAAKGIASRLGVNKKTRHIAVHYLWLQQKVDEGEVELVKVKGTKNPADLGTKYLTQDKMDELMGRANVELAEGRHELTPKSQEKENEEYDSP